MSAWVSFSYLRRRSKVVTTAPLPSVSPAGTSAHEAKARTVGSSWVRVSSARAAATGALGAARANCIKTLSSSAGRARSRSPAAIDGESSSEVATTSARAVFRYLGSLRAMPTRPSLNSTISGSRGSAAAPEAMAGSRGGAEVASSGASPSSGRSALSPGIRPRLARSSLALITPCRRLTPSSARVASRTSRVGLAPGAPAGAAAGAASPPSAPGPQAPSRGTSASAARSLIGGPPSPGERVRRPRRGWSQRRSSGRSRSGDRGSRGTACRPARPPRPRRRRGPRW